MEVYFFFAFAIFSVPFFILLIIVVYKKYLRHINKWYSTLFLILYPFIIYKLGIFIWNYGRVLNLKEVESRLHAGEKIVYGKFGELVHGPGEVITLYGGYIYAIAVYPIGIATLILVFINLLRR
ncbi:hypothetical protein [Bacillus sp. JCM 19034]|uniref:hypothetical protein n=1 Tax=Bacillus sp. JCM 19034 TaxID=1481928 RepID=UPI000785CDB0|nr:hypothetical protein [Bacillus sp. JCM 19034]